MAIRLAVLAHHYREDWDWTAAGFAEAIDRLAAWREAVLRAGSAGPDGAGPAVLAGIRDRIATDLDAPGALAVLDDWAKQVAGGDAAGSGPLVQAAVDAILGVAL
jgi:L-cysteine:1D-myo-inositol 2-amino-2-deoxy-alpha-D-glucopyranoside ligase